MPGVRIESSIPPPPPRYVPRRLRPCHLHAVAHFVRPDPKPRACDADAAPIPFSRYLEKHNRQDRDDVTRTALPLFNAPFVPVGGTLDVLA